MAGSPRPPLVAATVLIIGSAVAVDPWGWAPYGPLRFAVVSTSALVLTALTLRRGPFEVHKASALGWLAFIAWGIVAGIGALDPLYTWIGTPDRHLGLISFVLFGLVFFAGQSFTARPSILFLLKAAIVTLAVIGVYTLLEVAELAPVDLATPSGRPGGPYGTAAYLGAACALLIPLSVGAAADGLDSKRWRYFAIAAAAAGGFAALASQTRAGWVGLLAAGLISLPATAAWLRRRLVAGAAIAVGFVLVALLSPVGGRIVAAFDFADGTARGRLDEWQVGAAVAVNHPIAGVGFEGYRIAFAEGVDADYERRYTRETMPDRAHNGPLDVAATTGIPGLALYLAGAGFLVRRGWHAARSRRPLLVGLGAAIVGYLAQQWFLFPLAEVDPVFWLFAGILIAATPAGPSVRLARPRWGWMVPMALAGFSLAVGALDVAADHRAAAASDHVGAGDLSSALVAAGDAAGLRPDSVRYYFIAAVTAAEADTAVGYSRAVGRLDQALEISPGDPILRAEHASYLLRFAQAARDPALLAAATSEWEALAADDPVHARYRLELGNAYALAGSNERAEAQWLAAADLAPGSTAPLTNLAALYLATDRRDDARAALDRARQIDPTASEIDRIAALLDG